HGKQMSFNFTDNFGQDGVADIQIENTSLKLKIKSKESLELAFDLNSKSDAPLKEKISKDTLLSWLKTRTTISDIKALGYEIEYVTSWGSEEGTNRFYKISDTDIRFLTSAYDPTKEDLWSAPIQTDVYNNPFIMAIEAKAELMCPERIGQKDDSYIDDGIKYYPNGVPYNGSAQTEINHDTPVLVASDKLLSRNELLLPEKWYYTDDNSAETENDQSSFSLYD
ncbi:MAG: hypothetical protein IJQ28_00385, partial [Clostridia bacterium]|nr:hypothetical protein [Clostridia bacterium]